MYFFVGESNMCTGCICWEKNGQSTKGCWCLLDLAITYLHGGQPPSCQKVGSSLRTRLASQADHKNKLSIAPILQIFIFKEMLFLRIQYLHWMYLLIKNGQSLKCVVGFCNNALRWWSSSILSNSGILIYNPLDSQIDQKNGLSIAPISLIFYLRKCIFLLNPTCTLDVFTAKKIGPSIKRCCQILRRYT